MYNQLSLTYQLGYAGSSSYRLSLNDRTNMRVEKYYPHVGNEGDQYVAETIELLIAAVDRNVVYRRKQELEYIIQLGKESWEEGSAFPVYMEVVLPDANDIRRTQIVDGRVEIADNALDSDILGMGWILCRLIITRLNWFEGAYKDLNIYGQNQIAANDVRISNRADGATTTAYNGVKILASDLDGDLPGFARVSLVSFGGVAHALEIFRGNPFEGGDASFFNGGYSSLVLEAETYMQTSIVDANSSGTHYGQHAVTQDYEAVFWGSPTVSIPFVGNPPGWYALYARHPSASIPYTGWRLRGQLGAGGFGDLLASFEEDVSGFMRLCTFYWPSNKIAQYSNTSLVLEMEAKITPSGGTYQLDCLYIVPLDCAYTLSTTPGSAISFEEVTDFSSREMWDAQSFATRNTPYAHTNFGIRVGTPITLLPRLNNYLYVFNLSKDEGDPSGTLDLGGTLDIGVGYRPRFRTL